MPRKNLEATKRSFLKKIPLKIRFFLAKFAKRRTKKYFEVAVPLVKKGSAPLFYTNIPTLLKLKKRKILILMMSVNIRT